MGLLYLSTLRDVSCIGSIQIDIIFTFNLTLHYKFQFRAVVVHKNHRLSVGFCQYVSSLHLQVLVSLPVTTKLNMPFHTSTTLVVK